MSEARYLVGDDWRDHASCAGLPVKWWFPEQGASIREAVTVCNTCEVKTECLQYALDNGERFGIYGGTTARQRRQIRRRLNTPPRTKRIQHGTRNGYNWHLNHGQPPCWACTDAQTRYSETAHWSDNP